MYNTQRFCAIIRCSGEISDLYVQICKCFGTGRLEVGDFMAIFIHFLSFKNRGLCQACLLGAKDVKGLVPCIFIFWGKD